MTSEVIAGVTPLRSTGGQNPEQERSVSQAPVVVLPAMGVPARAYGRLAGELGERGHDATVVELPTSGDVGYDTLVRGSVGDAVSAASDAAGERGVVLVGHSLGGQLALLTAATRNDVTAVVLPAAGTIHWRGFGLGTGLRFLAFSQFAAVTARLVGEWPGDRFRFGGRQPRRLISDWARIARTGRLAPRGARDRYEPDLASLQLPVLSLTLAGDTYAPRSAADALLRAVPHADVTRRHLAGDHDHLSWLREPAGVVEITTSWLAGVPSVRR
jgi:predicted alpha/beta hydrolase